MGDGSYVLPIIGNLKWSKENVQFLVDFVVGCSLKLQEFDFSIDHLNDNSATVEIIEIK